MKRGYLLLCLTFFLWGSLYVVSKYAFTTVPPMAVLFLRYLVAAPLLYLLARRKGLKKIEKKHIPYFLTFGAVGYTLSIGTQLLATDMMDASLASLLNATNPVMISLFAVLLLKEKMTPAKVAGLACSLVGVVIVIGVGKGKVSLPGIALSLIAVIFWSLNSVLIRKVSGHYSSEQISFCAMAAALPFSLICTLVQLRSVPISFTPASAAAILYIGVFSTAAAFLCWNRCLSEMDASVCSLFYPLQPLFSAILGVVLLGEPLTVSFILGGIFISAGVIIGLKKSK